MAENMDRTKDETQPEKTFTQAEVNEIVKNRLARVKESAGGSEEEISQRVAEAVKSATAEKEKELQARENKLACKQFLIDSNYPLAFLDAIDTSDIEAFKKNVETVAGAVGSVRRVAPLGSPEPVIMGSPDPLSAAFGRDVKHVPKEFPPRYSE